MREKYIYDSYFKVYLDRNRMEFFTGWMVIIKLRKCVFVTIGRYRIYVALTLPAHDKRFKALWLYFERSNL